MAELPPRSGGEPASPKAARGSAPTPRAAASSTPTRRRAGLPPREPGAGSSLRRRILLLAAAAAAVVLLIVIAAVVYAYATLPDPSRLDLTGGAISIVDRHGALIEQRNAQGARVTPVPLSQISPTLRYATLAAEDRRFYEHHGIDWPRVAKALIVDVIARRPEQGASTIEEQLAKVAILNSPQRTGLTKLREFLLATALDARYSKSQILEFYLNSIYYGHGATGIETASRVYFDTHASNLTLAQASLLAGLPRGPSFYDPKLYPDRAKARQAYVLDGMVKQHWASEQQARAAAATNLTYSFKEERSAVAPHFVDFMLQQLEKLYGPEPVARGGFRVKTTLDLTLQQAAEHAVQVGIQKLGPQGADNGDLLAIDPRNGQILAMVGSADYFNDKIKGQFNVVTAPRQPGSSFKPYVYEEAFREHKLTMGSLLEDRSSSFANGRFHDFDNRDMGWITAHKSLLLSRNVSTLHAMVDAGIDNVNNLARSFGISTNLKSEVTTAIGSSEVTMLDQVVGYGVFATGGVKHPATAILEVTDRQGNTLDVPSLGNGDRVASPQETYLISYILKDYASQWDLGWDLPFAGKSGTTNNFRDAWMMAYAPNLVIGAWMGHTSSDANMNSVYGSMVGSTVLRDFINNGLARANIRPQRLQRPPGLVEAPGCSTTADGGRAPAGAATSSGTVFRGPELYLPGTEKLCPHATASPSASPSKSPTAKPSLIPSILPSATPSRGPSPTPTAGATAGAGVNPTP